MPSFYLFYILPICSLFLFLFFYVYPWYYFLNYFNNFIGLLVISLCVIYLVASIRFTKYILIYNVLSNNIIQFHIIWKLIQRIKTSRIISIYLCIVIYHDIYLAQEKNITYREANIRMEGDSSLELYKPYGKTV